MLFYHRLLYRSLLVWLMFILAESLNGTIRNFWLIPTLGDRLAHQLSFLIGSGLIITIATLFIRWLNPQRLTQMLGIGLLWVLLTLGFEMSLGRFVLGYSWERILADYNLTEGGLMGIGLLLILVAPWIATQLHDLLFSYHQNTQHRVIKTNYME